MELCVGGIANKYTTFLSDIANENVAERLISLEKSRGSVVYCTDGDGLTDYICGSEFMMENHIGQVTLFYFGVLRLRLTLLAISLPSSF